MLLAKTNSTAPISAPGSRQATVAAAFTGTVHHRRRRIVHLSHQACHPPRSGVLELIVTTGCDTTRGPVETGALVKFKNPRNFAETRSSKRGGSVLRGS